MDYRENKMDSQRFWLDIAIPTRTRAYALRRNIPNILSQAEKTGAAISFYDNASTDDTEDYFYQISLLDIHCYTISATMEISRS